MSGITHHKSGRRRSTGLFRLSIEATMLPLAQNRKLFIKKGLIPTVLHKTASKQKKSRRSGSQGKTGRKIRPIRQAVKLPESRRTGCIL
ncbi:hypothetical protein ACQ3G6_02040 [Allorhizobium undicola]|uniref:hypothetical protein n=1 Tax=Allorhizobium undicola TaxID=78527 RepID=UPI0012B640A7|nr:hypothetical protein [Allorhizobium undicola]